VESDASSPESLEPTPPGPGYDRPIGIFDSGVGGLSIVRQIRLRVPCEDLVFVADQVHVPYGPRSLDEVRQLSTGISRFLLDVGAKLIVVACNTASAAALQHLRSVFPATPFVGMEPAVKPAAEQSRSRKVGVLATPATFQGVLYASVVERFAQGVEVLPQTLPGLVQRIEAGELDGLETERIVRAAVRGLVERGADTLVLACTHYPFVIPLIAGVAGPTVRVIDPSPAIARQAGRLLRERGLATSSVRAGQIAALTSGDPRQLEAMTRRLIGESAATGRVTWDASGTTLRGEARFGTEPR
jgi:glutamate racemase